MSREAFQRTIDGAEAEIQAVNSEIGKHNLAIRDLELVKARLVKEQDEHRQGLADYLKEHGIASG